VQPEEAQQSQASGFSGRTVLLMFGGAGLLACACVVGTLLILRSQRSEPVAPAEPAVSTIAQPAPQATVQHASPAAEPAVTIPRLSPEEPRITVAQATPAQVPPAVPAPAPVTSPPAQAEALPAAPAPAPLASTVAPTPVARIPEPLAKAAGLPAVVEQPSPAPAAEKPLISLPDPSEIAAQRFVAGTRIGAIRAGVKVLINSRSYKPGDLVEPQLGLRVIEIGGTHLVFTDASGRRYRRDL